MVLLNAILNNTSIYMLYFFKAPKSILDEIIKVHMDFLWSGGEGVRKINWVSWNWVFLAKKDCGLGVKHCEMLNKALISNWGW